MGTIYYWSPDYESAVGGVKIFYRDVDILNEHGYDAAVLHRKKGFRVKWFENDTRVTYMGKTHLNSDDYLVIPEVYGSLYADPAARPKASRVFKKLWDTPAKKVIFNQNTYNTFKGNSFDRHDRTIYRDENILAVMVVSEDNKAYLETAFPDLRIFRIHNSINGGMFSRGTTKKKQICFMPRKNRDHAVQVINFLKNNPALHDFNLVPIEGMNEVQVADVLKESLLFLSFGYPEGCPLPPKEAMASGCVVVGYTGMGGREYFKPDFCYPVEMGDVVGFARTVDEVVKIYREHPEVLADQGRQASEYILSTYTAEREVLDVLDTWENIRKLG